MSARGYGRRNATTTAARRDKRGTATTTRAIAVTRRGKEREDEKEEGEDALSISSSLQLLYLCAPVSLVQRSFFLSFFADRSSAAKLASFACTVRGGRTAPYIACKRASCGTAGFPCTGRFYRDHTPSCSPACSIWTAGDAVPRSVRVGRRLASSGSSRLPRRTCQEERRTLEHVLPLLCLLRRKFLLDKSTRPPLPAGAARIFRRVSNAFHLLFPCSTDDRKHSPECLSSLLPTRRRQQYRKCRRRHLPTQYAHQGILALTAVALRRYRTPL